MRKAICMVPRNNRLAVVLLRKCLFGIDRRKGLGAVETSGLIGASYLSLLPSLKIVLKYKVMGLKLCILLIFYIGG